jgi:hypothetical protein
MSDDLYHKRVQWDGLRQTGWAKVEEVKVKLASPPKLIANFMDLFYTPEVGQYEIRDDCAHPRRSMTKAEITSLEIWCDKLLRLVRGYVGNP